jgi:hypothetical protein
LELVTVKTMADIRINNGGLLPQNQNQPAPIEQPNSATQNAAQTGNVNLPVGQPGEAAQPNVLPQLPNEKIFSDAVTGRERSQLDAAEQMRGTAGISAVDKLLGLHLQPTVVGALTPPPGNSEALRHLTPAMRRAIMRDLLEKQRDRTRRLAKYVRRQRDRQEDDDEETSQNFQEESFIALLTEGALSLELDENQVERATGELVTMARMLDLLDEMLNLQDYTFSQMGSFAQG